MASNGHEDRSEGAAFGNHGLRKSPLHYWTGTTHSTFGETTVVLGVRVTVSWPVSLNLVRFVANCSVEDSCVRNQACESLQTPQPQDHAFHPLMVFAAGLHLLLQPSFSKSFACLRTTSARTESSLATVYRFLVSLYFAIFCQFATQWPTSFRLNYELLSILRCSPFTVLP